jgi:CBS domain containing-hemolysin-like protein
VSASGLTAIVLLLAANAFFVAAEFGLIAVRRSRLEELATSGNRRAWAAREAVERLNLMLSGCQLGITFASLGLGWVGEPALADVFERLFGGLPSPLDAVASHGAASVIAFAVITGLHIVVGELVPKNLAIAIPEGTALWVAMPMRIFTALFRPLIWLLNESANLVVRLVGVTPRAEVATLYTPEELAIIVGDARHSGAVDPWQSELLRRALSFRGKRASDAMTPRSMVHAIGADEDAEEVIRLSGRTGRSRFPVWRDQHDDFAGVVLVKDALRAGRQDPTAKVADAMRDAIVVPESLSLEDVLVRMQRDRSHLVVVVDEYGSAVGIVTLEDVLEELLGEIRDEHDAAERGVQPLAMGFRVPGILRPDELAEATGCRLPDGDYETIAGFILQRLGRVARPGDAVGADGWILRVSEVRNRRIVSVDVGRSAA